MVLADECGVKKGRMGEVKKGEICLYIPLISLLLLSPVVFLSFWLFCRLNQKIFLKSGKSVTG